MRAEGAARFIDVRRQDLDPHRPDLTDIFNNLIGILHILGQKRRHEFDRVVGLEIGGLQGNQGVGGRMRLIEPVLGKHLHKFENGCRLFQIELVLFSPGEEEIFLLRHLRGFFLTHRAAQQVGAAERIIGQHLSDLHDLFLVDDDPVGILKQRLELRKVVDDLALAVLTLDKVIDHAGAQWAGTVEGADGDDIFEAVRLQFDQKLLHAARLKLEDTGRLTTGQELVGLRIVVLHRPQIEIRLFAMNQANAVIDNG